MNGSLLKWSYPSNPLLMDGWLGCGVKKAVEVKRSMGCSAWAEVGGAIVPIPQHMHIYCASSIELAVRRSSQASIETDKDLAWGQPAVCVCAIKGT